MILKVVMSPIEPEGAFVDQVARLLPDTDQAEFQKLLEMKVCQLHTYPNVQLK